MIQKAVSHTLKPMEIGESSAFVAAPIITLFVQDFTNIFLRWYFREHMVEGIDSVTEFIRRCGRSAYSGASLLFDSMSLDGIGDG